jgi:hypothetical protein
LLTLGSTSTPATTVEEVLAWGSGEDSTNLLEWSEYWQELLFLLFLEELILETDLSAVSRELFSLGSEYDELELFSLEYLEELLPCSDLDNIFSILTLEELLSSWGLLPRCPSSPDLLLGL